MLHNLHGSKGSILRPVLTIVVVFVFLVSSYFGQGYYRIQKFVKDREELPSKPIAPQERAELEAQVEELKELANKLAREEGIPPTPKPRMVSDIGYIMNVDTKNDFWKGEKKIIWDVKIPSTGKLFVCEWDAGFSRFKKDDSVKLIHDANSEGADWTAQLVGFQGEVIDKVAEVTANDAEDLWDTACMEHLLSECR